MLTTYPIRFADQLRQHLKGLRKKRGLTQAGLGQLVGVSQARIAEIEASPGLVNLDQLLTLMAALGATLSLEEQQADAIVKDQPTPPKSTRTSPLEQAPDNKLPDMEPIKPPRLPSQSRKADAGLAPRPTSRGKFIVNPKKGTW